MLACHALVAFVFAALEVEQVTSMWDAPCRVVEVDGEVFVIAKGAIPARDVPHHGAVDSGAVIVNPDEGAPQALPPIIYVGKR